MTKKAWLHCHADTSYLDGRAFPREMAEAALRNGDEAIALTDHDEVGGQLEFQEACRKVGVKAVQGTEARWLRDIAESREKKTKGSDASHIVLLAENNQGLSNMWALSSLAYEEKYFYQKPNLTPELMREYRDGLFASDGCGLTRFAQYAADGKVELCRQEWGTLLDIFGDHFYSELHTWQFLDPQTPEQQLLNDRLRVMNEVKVQLADEMSVPLVIVTDAHYAFKEQWEQHRFVWDMSTYKKDQAAADERGQAADWLMSAEEALKYMGLHGVPASIVEEAFANSHDIAMRCNVEITPNLAMPRLYATDEEDIDAFIRACEEGFKRHVIDAGLDETVYMNRLEREARLIIDKGMAGYFNVVADYVGVARDGTYRKWIQPGAKPTPCLCGPGRGSAGGSLVTWLMGITSLDPIKYDLMFERFINPDRPDFPDIDVDFQKSQRLDIRDYIGKRYGEANVCAIGTRSRSRPRQMLIDLAKAMKIEWTEIRKMSALIEEVDRIDDYQDDEEHDDDAPELTWNEVLDAMGGQLAPYARQYPKLFEYMGQMVGVARQAGVHAAAVLVNTQALLGRVPTRRKPGGTGTLATQFDMHEIEALGGVKDDLLGNRGLDVLAQARQMIYDRHGAWLDYDGFGHGVPPDCPPEKIITFGDEQYNDPAIWTQLDEGQSAGIFQIHTPAGTKQAMRFKPRSLTDLADLVAINRPGVTRVPGLLDSYMRRRHGTEEVTYDHPMMADITGRTMGILVYQEDLIRTARVLANFTAGQAEGLRKAIGKKLADKIAEIKPQFLDGCLANSEFINQGGTEAIARKIWASLEAAGAYAFNRSHATGYAMQPCWELWTKRYYYDEFVTACLAVHDDQDKQHRFLREARRRGKTILGPDVNESDAHFTLVGPVGDSAIRYGLGDVRSVGPGTIPDILKKRPFLDLPDYLERCTKGGGRKKGVIDNLVKLGAFDWTGMGRQDVLDQVYFWRCGDEVASNKWGKLSYEERAQIVKEKQAARREEFPRFDFNDPQALLDIETELVGTFITEDPMAPYHRMIEAECIRHPNDIDDFPTNHRFLIGGELVVARTKTQKDGRQMAFLHVRWAGEDFDILAFADAWARCKGFLKVGAPVVCEAIKLKNRGCQLSTVQRLDYLND